MTQEQFYLNKIGRGCYKLPERPRPLEPENNNYLPGCVLRPTHSEYLIQENMLSEFSTPEQLAEARSNLGITPLLEELNRQLDERVLTTQRAVVEQTLTDNENRVLSSHGLYLILQQYYTKNDLDSLITKINELIANLIIVDNELSNESTNPVLNKVLTDAINGMYEVIVNRIINPRKKDDGMGYNSYISVREELEAKVNLTELENYYNKEQVDTIKQNLQSQIDEAKNISNTVIELVQTTEYLERLKSIIFNDLTELIPTKVSDLENDSLYVTSSEVSSEVSSAVNTAVSNLVNGAPEALDTLKEIADKLGDNDDAVAGLINQITEEKTRAKAAEKANSDNIDALNTALNDEISRAQEVEAEKANISDLATVATSGDYKDLKNVPVIEDNPGNREYVDLGLPSGTLWATMNVGASSETDYGNYYQYGKGAAQYAETRGRSDYSGTENPLDSSVDTAVQVWGGSWHMPTREQMQELIANTTYKWVTNYKGSGINGGTFTATNGAVLFIPAAGYWSDGSQGGVGSYGGFWGSSPNGSGFACVLNFRNGGKGVSDDYRECGYSVRGVLDPTPINKLHKVAESGNYNDLENTPTDISHFNNDAEYVTESELAPVAKSGSYTDLENKPDYLGYTDTAIANLINSAPTTLDTLKEIADKLGENDSALSTIMNTLATKANKSDVQDNEQVISTALNNLNNRIIELDTDKVDNSDLATVATTGSYTDLSDIPTIPAAQILSDWNLTDTSSKDYIKNKPTNVSLFTNDANYVTKEELDNTEEVVAAALNDLNTNKADKTEVFPVKATYEEMTEMRDQGKLIPGQYYQITDYVTTINEPLNPNARSAGHQFDILVRADSATVLNEQAWAVKHDGDTYFDGARMEAWQLKYCLDNIQWSAVAGTYVTEGGDEYKLIQDGTVTIGNTEYLLWKDLGGLMDDYDVGYAVSEDSEVGTSLLQFDSDTQEIVQDGWSSSIESVQTITTNGRGTITWMRDEWNNECPYDFKNIRYKRYMTTDSVSGRDGLGGKYMVAAPDNCPRGLSVEDTEAFIWAYTFSSDNAGGEQTDYSLTAEHQVHDNVMKANGSKLNNITFFGNNCYSMSFGNGCYNMSFGNYCYDMSFGNGNDSMSFGNNCYGMSFGYGNRNMSFGYGNGGMSFGNYCYDMSFGNGNDSMSFGNGCYNMSFEYGNNSMSFGNGNRNMSFGYECRNGTITEGVQYVDIPANTWNFQLLNGLAGTNSSHLAPSFATQKAYTQVACKNSSGQLKIYVPGDFQTKSELDNNYVNESLLWTGTQADYDNLPPTKSDTTIYIIKES